MKNTTQEKFLKHINSLIEYWGENGGNTKNKLEGLSMSILGAIDGVSPQVIGLKLVDEDGNDVGQGTLHENLIKNKPININIVAMDKSSSATMSENFSVANSEEYKNAFKEFEERVPFYKWYYEVCLMDSTDRDIEEIIGDDIKVFV